MKEHTYYLAWMDKGELFEDEMTVQAFQCDRFGLSFSVNGVPVNWYWDFLPRSFGVYDWN